MFFYVLVFFLLFFVYLLTKSQILSSGSIFNKLLFGFFVQGLFLYGFFYFSKWVLILLEVFVIVVLFCDSESSNLIYFSYSILGMFFSNICLDILLCDGSFFSLLVFILLNYICLGVCMLGEKEFDKGVYSIFIFIIGFGKILFVCIGLSSINFFCLSSKFLYFDGGFFGLDVISPSCMVFVLICWLFFILFCNLSLSCNNYINFVLGVVGFSQIQVFMSVYLSYVLFLICFLFDVVVYFVLISWWNMSSNIFYGFNEGLTLFNVFFILIVGGFPLICGCLLEIQFFYFMNEYYCFGWSSSILFYSFFYGGHCYSVLFIFYNVLSSFCNVGLVLESEFMEGLLVTSMFFCSTYCVLKWSLI